MSEFETAVDAIRAGLNDGLEDGNFTEAQATFGHELIDAVDKYTGLTELSKVGKSEDADDETASQANMKVVILSDLAHSFFSDVSRLAESDEVDQKTALIALTNTIANASA